MVAIELHRPHTAAHALELQGVSRRFGGLVAVRDVSFALEPGERRAIIGPNGAGKTTLFNLITGDLRPTNGTIRFFGRDVTTLPHTSGSGWGWREHTRRRSSSRG